MPAVLTCPQCSAQLRLEQMPQLYAPILCATCNHIFAFEPMGSVSLATPAATTPARAPAAPPPAPAPVGFASPPPPVQWRDNGPPAPAAPAPPPPPAPVGFASPPPPVQWRDEIAPPATAPAVATPPPPATPPPVLTLTEPPLLAATVAVPPVAPPPVTASPMASVPPPVAAGQTAPAGLPTPVNQGRSGTTHFQMPFLETLMGAILTVGLLVGLIAGGLYLWRNSTAGNSEATAAAAKADDGTLAPEVANKEIKLASQNPALPPELVGMWDARTDDIAISTLELAPTGGAMYVSSSDGALAIPNRGFWNMKEHRGDEYVIDFVPANSVLNIHRFTLTLTAPDAFTQTRLVVNRNANRDEVRFVRRPRNP